MKLRALISFLSVFMLSLSFASRSLGGETAVTPVAMETSSYSNYAYRLMDGDFTNYGYNWANSNVEHWFLATFAEPTVIHRIDIYQNISGSKSTLKTFVVEGASEAKTDWVTVASFTDFPKPTEDYVASVIAFDNNEAYVHYRVREMANNAHAGGAVAMRASEVVYWSPSQGSPGDEDPDPGDDTDPSGIDLSVVTKRLDKLLTAVGQIEFYLAVLSSVSGLVMGLVLWRIVLLSKNQRRLF